jgi:hypothetical protein
MDYPRNAAELQVYLKKLGFDVVCTDRTGPKPNCKGCYTPDLHVAVGVLDVALGDNGDGYSDAICLTWLPLALRVAERHSDFAGYSIEVVQP